MEEHFGARPSCSYLYQCHKDMLLCKASPSRTLLTLGCLPTRTLGCHGSLGCSIEQIPYMPLPLPPPGDPPFTRGWL